MNEGLDFLSIEFIDAFTSIARLLRLYDKNVMVVCPSSVDDDVGKDVGALVLILQLTCRKADALRIVAVTVVLAVNVPVGEERLEILRKLVCKSALMKIVVQEIEVSKDKRAQGGQEAFLDVAN